MSNRSSKKLVLHSKPEIKRFNKHVVMENIDEEANMRDMNQNRDSQKS